MKKPKLFILSGLLGTGKSTIAMGLCANLNATFVRVDTIEQGLKDICNVNVRAGEGYEMAHLISADNLRLGLDVVADSVNPLDITREGWMKVAAENEATFINIEVTCSNKVEHKFRIENRKSTIKNLKSPTWQEVQNREYHSWVESRIVIDTAGVSPQESIALLLEKIRES